jgi:hypothetical protein
MHLLQIDLLNLSLCAAHRARLALQADDEPRSLREWTSSDLWLSRAAATPLAATPLLTTPLAATPLSPSPYRLRRLSAHALIGLYHSTQPTPNPEDRLVAYGNAVQSWLLSPDATTSRTLLSDLNLPQLTYGALRRAGYTYADEVSGLADAQLLTVRNLGPKGVSLLREALSRHAA